MRCFEHNEREAVGTCAGCGAGGCAEFLRTRSEGALAKKRLTRLAVVSAVSLFLSLVFFSLEPASFPARRRVSTCSSNALAII